MVPDVLSNSILIQQPPDPPAARLAGLDLGGGWKAVRKVTKNADATGGCFSVGYEAEHSSGRRGFVKALDFSEAFNAENVAKELERAAGLYNFEKELLEHCKDSGMHRVVTPIFAGEVAAPGAPPPLNRVLFLVFEMATGDSRAVLNTQRATLEWKFRALHNIASALQQLHGRLIAHQDLKPSNILDFEQESSTKVCDLGRASRLAISGPFDSHSIAGDVTYAPPELLYGFAHPEWRVRRLGCDLYSFGSLIMFFFSQASMTPLMQSQLDPLHRALKFTGTFEDALPLLRVAFGKAIEVASPAIRTETKKAAVEVIQFIRELCDPAPAVRGSPSMRSSADPHSLERYISRFDHLARRASLGAI